MARRMTKKEFIRQNKEYIVAYINKLLHQNKRYSYSTICEFLDNDAHLYYLMKSCCR